MSLFDSRRHDSIKSASSPLRITYCNVYGMSQKSIRERLLARIIYSGFFKDLTFKFLSPIKYNISEYSTYQYQSVSADSLMTNER